MPKETPKPPEPERRVHSGGGQGTRFGPAPKRTPLWTVRWKEASLDLAEGGLIAGAMEGVTGDLYEGGKVASTFAGARAQADKKEDRLTLEGRVRLESKAQRAILTCDKVEYLPGKRLVRALGNVKIETENGVIQAGDALYATPDLKHVASPNLFKP